MQPIPENIDGKKVASSKGSKSNKPASGRGNGWVDEDNSYKAGYARRLAEDGNSNAF